MGDLMVLVACVGCSSIMSEQCLSREFKPCMVESESRNGQMEATTIPSSELFSINKDPQPCNKQTKQQQTLQNYHSGNTLANHKSLDLVSTNCNNTNYCFSRDATFDAPIIEKLDPFGYCGWSTSDEMTTSSDIDVSTSTVNSKSQANDVSSNFQDSQHVSIPNDFKGHFNLPPHLIIYYIVTL